MKKLALALVVLTGMSLWVSPALHAQGLTEQQKAFGKAITLKDFDAINALIDQGADVNRLLFEAISVLNIDLFKLAIERDAKVNYQDKYGNSALHKLSRVPLDTADVLRAKFDPPDEDISRHIQTRIDRLEMIDLLVQQGANINAVNNKAETPISTAFKANQPMLVDYFIAKNVDASVGLNIFQTNTVHLFDTAYLKYLLDYGYRATPDEGDETTPLHKLVQHTSEEDKIALLLEYGADINGPDSKGNTPLVASAATGKANVEKVYSALVSLGADVPPAYTQARLTTAISDRDHVAALQLIEQAPESVNGLDGEGLTPLMQASKGSLKLIRILLDNSAELNMRANGRNALDEAVASGHAYIVRYLLKQGGDVNVYKSNKKKQAVRSPALAAAVSNGNLELIKLVLDNGATTTHDAPEDTHPLIIATQNGQLDAIRLLLERGMDNKVKTSKGSLASIALDAGHTDIVDYLKSQGIE